MTKPLPNPLTSTVYATTLPSKHKHANGIRQTTTSTLRSTFLAKKINSTLSHPANLNTIGSQVTRNSTMGPTPTAAKTTLHTETPYTRSLRGNRTQTSGAFTPSSIKFDTAQLTNPAAFLNTVYKNREEEKSKATLSTVNMDETVAFPNTQSVSSEPTAGAAGGPPNPLHVEIDQIRSYLTMLDTYSLHNFLIWRGKAVTNTPEFSSYHRKYGTIWGAVLTVLSKLEEMLRVYGIPLAVVDGTKLAELSACDGEVVTEEDLLGVISNIEQVLPTVNALRGSDSIIGSKGSQERRNACVTRVQNWARMVIQVARFKDFRRRSRAAIRIQSKLRQCFARWRVRLLLTTRREDDALVWEELKEKLGREWRSYGDPNRSNNTSHFVLHVPSLTIEEYLRLGLDNFPVHQNLQLTRLMDCANANVSEVIYVAPFPLDEEIVEYYKKVLTLGGVDLTSSGPDRKKFTVVVPENIDRFPRHFSLASVLRYSPHAMQRIRQAVMGKSGYMVPGLVGYVEKYICTDLKVPMLGNESDVVAGVGCRSGGKRVFMESDVSVGVGAHDIYDEDDFVVALTKLIASQLDVERWMFRCDVDYKNVGSAYFDVDRLKVMKDLRKERAMLCGIHKGDNSVWLHPDVQLLARAKILKEVRTVLYAKGVCCGREMFFSLKEFLRVFMRMGGVIEAEPVNVIGRPTMNILITPLAEIHMLSTVDLLVDDESVVVGSSYPMTSVPGKALEGAARAVAGKLREKGFVGYASINFIAYRAANAGEKGAGGSRMSARRELRMCGVSVDPGLTNAGSMYNFVKFVCGEGGENETEEPLTRAYSCCDGVYNPGLMSVQYGSFFKLCRMQAVSFDLESLSGLMFMLYDSLAAGLLGMVAVGENPAESLDRLHGGFGFIKSNVGNAGAYNEVNLDDPGEGGMGQMASFVRIMRAVENESRRVGLLHKAETRRRLAKEARGGP